MSTQPDELRPEDIGFDPKKFPHYRNIQLEAIERVTQGEARFQALALPTGAGKSLVAASIYKLTGWRTVVLTSTKGLQEQYLKDFADIGMIDIRGKQNYECSKLTNKEKRFHCADGKRMGCRIGACTYDLKRKKAKESDLIITNYAYWLRAGRRALERTEKEAEEEGDNPIECLILDEAHASADEVSNSMACRLYEKELVEMLGWEETEKLGVRLKDWIEAAEQWHREADIQLSYVTSRIESKGSVVSKAELIHAEKMEALVDKLDRIRDIEAGEWVMEQHESPKWGRSWEFDVIWPGRYAEQKLFQYVEHIVLMSATLRPKTLSLLGINKDQHEFKEWSRIFPPNRCPIYYLPARREDGTAVRINYHSKDSDLKLWVDWIDQIIEPRLDRKGIIHTFAYHRQEYLMKHSKYSKLMIGNTNEPDSLNATFICQKFKDSTVPLILCSPSFSTGWDFPGDECEYVIISKVPFPPGRSKVMQARKEKDESYLNYLAMQDLVQSSGRGMRSAEDRCEVFIADASCGWFLAQNRALAPSWFVNGVKRAVSVPKAAPKL